MDQNQSVKLVETETATVRMTLGTPFKAGMANFSSSEEDSEEEPLDAEKSGYSEKTPQETRDKDLNSVQEESQTDCHKAGSTSNHIGKDMLQLNTQNPLANSNTGPNTDGIENERVRKDSNGAPQQTDGFRDIVEHGMNNVRSNGEGDPDVVMRDCGNSPPEQVSASCIKKKICCDP